MADASSQPVAIQSRSRLQVPEAAGTGAQAFSSLAPFGSSPRTPDIARAFDDYYLGAARTDRPPSRVTTPTAVPIRLSTTTATTTAADGALLTRVLTLNVRYDNAADGRDAWAYRLDDLADLVATYRPMVAGLQEALARQVYQLDSRLARHGYRWVGVGRDDGQDGGEFCPLFYDADALHLHDWNVFWLSPTPDVPGSRHEAAALPRLCTWAKVQRRAGANAHKPFFVFVTHFDHASPAARLFSAHLLLDRIRDIAGLYPCVVLGDLNCVRREAAYGTLLASAFLDDAFAAGPQPGDDSPTFTGFRVDSDDSSATTLDYVLVSGFHVAGYKVLRERRRDGRRISDHRPVVADVLMRTEGSGSSDAGLC
jgi:endonuclease/exonuclease/phosphatase family metal-dependent hydrolase